VVEHHPAACRRCGTLLQGEDPDPMRHKVIEIPPITPLVIEHRLHRWVPLLFHQHLRNAAGRYRGHVPTTKGLVP